MRPLKNVYPRRMSGRAEMKRRGHVLAASWSSQTDKQTAAPCRWHHDVKLRSPPSAPLGSSSSAAVDIRAPARGGELVCGCVCVCICHLEHMCWCFYWWGMCFLYIELDSSGSSGRCSSEAELEFNYSLIGKAAPEGGLFSPLWQWWIMYAKSQQLRKHGLF